MDFVLVGGSSLQTDSVAAETVCLQFCLGFQVSTTLTKHQDEKTQI